MKQLLYKTIKELEDSQDIQIIDGDRGKNYPKKEEFKSTGFCVFLNASNIKDDSFVFENIDFISEEKDNMLRKGKLSRKDIVITTRGTVGLVAYYGDNILYDNMRINSGMIIIRVNSNVINPNYFYQLLKSKSLKKQYQLFASGCAQPQLPIQDFRLINIPIFSKTHQDKIAKVLSNYDDLIENNNKRIKILEEMAQKIYKEWFVDFKFPGHETTTFKQTELGEIPSDWEVKNLFDFADVLYGYAFKSNLFTEKVEATPVVRIRDIKNQKTNTYSPEIPDEKYYIRDKEVLIGMDGEFHMCNWLGGKAYLNQRVAKLKPKDNKSYFYLLLLLQKPIKKLNIAIQGTTVAHLGDTHLRNLNFAIPNDKLLAEFNALAENFLEEILSLIRKNVFLKQTRDLLLPRLISGEIDVENLDIE